jgi:hypothetical protein
MSELGFIAVPGGAVADGIAPLQALVVPRLDTTVRTRLADFGLGDWEATLAAATVHVEVRSGPAGAPTRIEGVTRMTPQPGLWRAFFGPDAVVAPRDLAPFATPDVTPTSEQERHITAAYRAAATDAAGPRAAGPHVAALAATVPARAGAPPPRPTAGDDDGRAEFHRTVALLREHPAVLRALGLVIDFGVPASALPRTDGGDELAVRVRCEFAPAAIPLPTPATRWTRYDFDTEHFLPASTPTVDRGMVMLGDPGRWGVGTFDVDGAVERLLAPSATEDGVLPPLRSAGLLLLRKGRRAVLAERAAPTAADRDLTADDLVLGYRIDVHDGTAWRSLGLRRATYHLGGQDVVPEDGEEDGHLKTHSAVADDQGLSTDEVVARWGGWSLSVPATPPSRRRSRTATDPVGWKFAVVPGSLPSLRFGRGYQLRARVADAAGGGLRHDDPAAARDATDTVVYRRHEPVPPPRMPPPADLSPGARVDRLVVRSDRGVTAAQLEAQDPRYPATDERPLLPPPTTVALAEQHGRLDGADAATLALAQRGVRAPSEGDGDALPDPAAGGIMAHPLDGAGSAADQRDDWVGTWPQLHHKAIALQARAGGGPAVVAWDHDDRLVARLAPAQQVTLELSSSPAPAVVAHLAVSGYLDDAGQGTDRVLAGRHPMATPPRVVQLVHAVRRPVQDPGGTFRVEREPWQTFATLVSQLDVHTASTAQLDVTASWPEQRDAPEPVPVSGVAVASLAIAPGPLALPPLRHEFGDTRHREVSYTLTAVSRFRDCFAADELAGGFLATTTLPAISILSSARPPDPQVVSVLPAFRWEEERDGPAVRRRRTGGRLRVELAHPWFESGAGEQLAVVIGPDTAPQPALRDAITQAGRDPIWQSGPVPRWLAPDALGAPGARARAVTVPEVAGQVVAVPHDVFAVGGRWFADVVLAGLAASSYSPFVQLAVARYQERSIADHELSRIIRTDPVSLLPDRELTVERRSDRLAMKLAGTGPDGPRPTAVTAVLERLQGGEAAALSQVGDAAVGGVPAWVRVGNPVRGELGLPLPELALPGGAGQLRVVVAEEEPIPSSAGPEPAGLGGRVTFADAVAVP